MRPQFINLEADGTSDPAKVDYEQASFKLGLQVSFKGGSSGTYTVESTMDDPDGANAEWFDVLDLAALTAAAQGNIFFPVRAVRMVVSNHNDVGRIHLAILQGRSN